MRDELFRWVHISDLHIGHDDYVESVMRDELPEYLKSVVNRNKMDCLIITGDLIFAKKYLDQKKDIKDKVLIVENIENIQNAIGVNKENTFIVPGNHDVVRDKNRSTVIRGFLPQYRSPTGVIPENVLEVIKASEERFANLYTEILGRPYQQFHHVEQGPKGMKIVCLDTTIFSEVMKEDEKERALEDKYLIIGSKMLRECFKNVGRGQPVIAIGHHPITAFSSDEQNIIISAMKKAGVILYLCGHTHTAEISNISGNENVPLWQVCCGTNMERLENKDPADMKIFVGEYNITKKRGFIRSYRYNPDTRRQGWEIDSNLVFPRSELDENLSIDRFYFPLKANPVNYVHKKYLDYMDDLTRDVVIYVKPNIEFERACSDSRENRFLIKADTGYGKTILLKKMIRYFLFDDTDIAWENIFPFSMENIFPLWISCKSLEGSLEEFDPVDLVAKYLQLNDETNYPYKEIFIRWSRFLEEKGSLFLLIDGLDEITDDERRNDFINALRNYLDKNSNTGVIIVSKLYACESYQTEGGLKEFGLCSLYPFNEDSIRSYCEKWFELRGGKIRNKKNQSKRAKNLAEKIFRDKTIYELAKIPLLLDTMLQVNKLNDTLPNNRVMLYREWIYALLKDSEKVEEDISLLAAIAFEMNENGMYQISNSDLERTINTVYSDCDWIFLEEKEKPFELACNFINRIEKTSKILVHHDRTWHFYHGAFQDYLVSVALIRGLYPRLKKEMDHLVPLEQCNKSPAMNKLLEFSCSPDKSEIIILTVAQMGAFESALVIENLIQLVDNHENGMALDNVKKSNLRNLLLRIILEGAYVTKSQRMRIYEVVQKHNLSDLQADSLQKIWSSRFGEEFKATCSEYMNEMFELLTKSPNPVQELLDQIYDKVKQGLTEESEKELEKKLYVLDGIIWSNGVKYLNRLEGDNAEEKFSKLASLIFEIILNAKIDGISARRACGVNHRLIDTGIHISLNEQILYRIFDIFSCKVDVKYREKEDVDYSGIRIFSVILQSQENMESFRSIKLDRAKKNFLNDLYMNSQNLQDKYAVFWAIVLSRSWSLKKIQKVMAEDDDFSKSPISDREYLKNEIYKLEQADFFTIDNDSEGTEK